VLGRQTRYERKVAPYEASLVETRSYADGAGEHTVEVEEKVGSEVAKRRKLWLDAMGRTLQVREYVKDDAAEVVADRYFTYDPRGNVTMQREPIGDGPTAAEATTGTTAVTVQSYDAAGNLLSASDAKGHKTEYSHHADGLLKTKDGPHSGEHWTYEYDAFGQLAKTTLQAPESDTTGWKGGTWKYEYRLTGGATAKETTSRSRRGRREGLAT
jgi:YD repeat-containing protein